MTTAAIIPARWASSRFPGKPLFPIRGKPLIQHVWERCLKAKTLSQIVIATDDMRIAETAFDFGAEVSLTSPRHPSGTDRVAEVAAGLRRFRHIINVQGDEPAVDPRLIDRIAQTLERYPKLEMVTAGCPFETESDALNPNNVKVVTALDGRALYFSRSLIPFERDKSHRQTPGSRPLWHIGIYGYRRDFLAAIRSLEAHAARKHRKARATSRPRTRRHHSRRPNPPSRARRGHPGRRSPGGSCPGATWPSQAKVNALDRLTVCEVREPPQALARRCRRFRAVSHRREAGLWTAG